MRGVAGGWWDCVACVAPCGGVMLAFVSALPLLCSQHTQLPMGAAGVCAGVVVVLCDACEAAVAAAVKSFIVSVLLCLCLCV